MGSPPLPDLVLETKDLHGSIVRFHRKNYDKHKNKHRVLENKSFCPGQIVKTLKKPTLTIPGNLSNTICYYLEEFAISGIIRYTKVVVHQINRHATTDPHCVIMTAYPIDHIQELKYGLKPTYY